MSNKHELDKSDFVRFCEELSRLWESTSFENLLSEAKEELLQTKTLKEFENSTKKKDGYGIYCFWIEQEELEGFDDFTKIWNATKENYALTQPKKSGIPPIKLL